MLEDSNASKNNTCPIFEHIQHTNEDYLKVSTFQIDLGLQVESILSYRIFSSHHFPMGNPKIEDVVKVIITVVEYNRSQVT
jgi:hypothetical protein